MKFQVHTITSAPEASRPLLQAVASQHGFVPNLFGVLAGSPAALGAYLGIAGALNRTRLTPVEREIVTLAVTRGPGDRARRPALQLANRGSSSTPRPSAIRFTNA